MRINETDYRRIMRYTHNNKMTVAELIRQEVNQYMGENP